MHYKCLGCGHIFEEGEEKPIREVYPDVHFERVVYGCPVCGDYGYQETERCKDCGGIFLEDELCNGFCVECAEKKADTYIYNFEECYKISKKTNSVEAVEIDSFLSTMFSVDEINEILIQELRKASTLKPINCKGFVESDKSWFIDIITEEVNE